MHFKENAPDSSPDARPDPLRAPTMWAATGFGASDAGQAKAVDSDLRPAIGGELLHVCHVGVVLRVVLGVQALVWLAALHGARGGLDWLQRAAMGSAEALPACLMWLVLVCGLRRWLARLPLPWAWTGVVALGALAGFYGHVQWGWLAWRLGGVAPWGFWSWIGPAATGAAVAGACMLWLAQRQAKVLPEQTQARLVELQARIRPHFLFNTLNTAVALVQIDPDRAEAVLEDLAELFRRALVSPDTTSTLAQEVDLARRYLGIEQQRFGDRMKVSWAVDQAVDDAAVPTLLLQPLVENAVKYGVEASTEGGWIKVQTELKGGRVQVMVSNSLPMQPDAAAGQVRAGHGIALRNVRQRLMLMHDVQAQFEAGPRAVSPGAAAQCYVVRCSWPVGALT